MYMQIVLCATREVLVDVTILHGVQQFTREVYRDFKTMNVQKTSNIISASDVNIVYVLTCMLTAFQFHSFPRPFR